MVQATPLHHVNGGAQQPLQCAHCQTYLGNERAVANTPGGVKFFCKMEPGDNPQDSCYLQWKMRRH
jgi:hypothetical protein